MASYGTLPFLLVACSGVAASSSAPVQVVSGASTPTPAATATPDAASTAAASTAAVQPAGFLGTNLSAVAYWSGDRQFMNLVIGSNWVDGSWAALPATQVDLAGNVTSLQSGQVAHRVLTPPAGSLSGNGVTIRCTWSGTGTVRVAGARTAGSDVYADHSVRFIMPTFATGHWTWLELSATNASDPVRKLDCREADADTQAVFSPEFLAALKPFSILRFMDWSGVNNNPTNPQWADRTPADSINQAPVAWENMAAIAAKLDADAWYNVPYDVQEDYATRLGHLIHDLTPAGRKVYVELGNEVWNYAFKVTAQAQAEGQAEQLDTANAGRAALLRYAEKTAWLMKLWTPIFADRPGQLVRVLATQNANPWCAEQELAFRDTAKWVDALATAPYFGTPIANSPGVAAATLMPAIASAASTVLAGTATSNSQIAKKYGKRYIAYEAGQSLVDANDIPRLIEINRSAAMYDIYRSYLADWKTRFGDTMMLFTSTTVTSASGAWGLRERAGQALTEAPKYRAATEFGR